MCWSQNRRRAGYLPEQGGYSATMTEAEKRLYAVCHDSERLRPSKTIHIITEEATPQDHGHLIERSEGAMAVSRRDWWFGIVILTLLMIAACPRRVREWHNQPFEVPIEQSPIPR